MWNRLLFSVTIFDNDIDEWVHEKCAMEQHLDAI